MTRKGRIPMQHSKKTKVTVLTSSDFIERTFGVFGCSVVEAPSFASSAIALRRGLAVLARTIDVIVTEPAS